MIHAMHKEAAAIITRRSVAELEKLGHEIIPMSYDVRDYAKLGLLFKLLHAEDPQNPTATEVTEVKQALAEAIDDARAGKTDLSSHLDSDAAKKTRKAGIAARTALEAQWQNFWERIMSMARVLLDALVPIFVGLLLGYIAGRRGMMDNVNVRNLIVLVMTLRHPVRFVFGDQSNILGCPRKADFNRPDDHLDICGVVFG